jgi:Flp pilus assembly protein CpaB
MQPRTSLAILALFGCAFTPIGVAWMTVKRVQTGATTLAHVEPAEVPVNDLVARRRVPQGTFIKQPEEWFELKQSRRLEHVVTKFDQLQDRVLSKDIALGETVDPAALLGKKQLVIGGLSVGLRAQTIQVSHSDRWAFQPGSLVCVELTVSKGSTEGGYTQTVLENTLLLAADPLDPTKPREGSGPWTESATLKVTPEDAQVLALAQQMGTLRLVPARTK